MELVKELPEIFEEFAEQRQRSFLWEVGTVRTYNRNSFVLYFFHYQERSLSLLCKFFKNLRQLFY